MSFLTFHLLRNVPYSNVNRDREGKPKTAVIGGVKRGRISSQSLNHSLRNNLKASMPNEWMGIRTRNLGELVENEAAKIPSLKDDAEKGVIRRAVTQLFKYTEKKNDEKTEKNDTQMLFVSQGDAPKIANCIQQFKEADPEGYKAWADPKGTLMDMFDAGLAQVNGFDKEDADAISERSYMFCEAYKEAGNSFDLGTPNVDDIMACIQWLTDNDDVRKAILKKRVKGASKKAMKAANGKIHGIVTKNGVLNSKELDIALFGRMLAQAQVDSDDKDTIGEVTGAMTTMHAFSVHELEETPDFFTAFDDITQSSGHLSEEGKEKMMHSSCFYEYFCVDLDALRTNFKEAINADNMTKVMVGLFKGIFSAVPDAMGRKTASNQTIPSAVMVEYIPKGMPITYMNAFEKPVRPGMNGGVIEPAVERLIKYAGFYANEIPKAQRVWLSLEGYNGVESLNAQVATSVEGGANLVASVVNQNV